MSQFTNLFQSVDKYQFLSSIPNSIRGLVGEDVTEYYIIILDTVAYCVNDCQPLPRGDRGEASRKNVSQIKGSTADVDNHN